MTDTDSLIEAVARDLWPLIAPRILPDTRGVPWRHIEPGSSAHAQAIEAAQLIVERVRSWEAENGWRCVPVEADDGMMMAAVDRQQPDRHDKAHPWGGMYRAIHSAMVSASPPPPGSAEGVKP